jgi:hypothetical protein
LGLGGLPCNDRRFDSNSSGEKLLVVIGVLGERINESPDREIALLIPSPHHRLASDDFPTTWPWRFNLRTLFIATTFLAVVLGMIAWLDRAWIGK